MNLTIEERSANLDKMLDEYSEKIGISSFKHDNIAIPILNYTDIDIRGLTDEECGESGYILHRYAGYIQKECNRINAHIKWLTRCINIELADKITNYGTQYTSFQERMLLAQNDKTNDYMDKMQTLMIRLEVRKEELSFMASKVTAMATTLVEQKYTKKREKNE